MPKLVTLADVACVLHAFLPLRSLYFLARVHGRMRYRLRRKDREAVSGNLSSAFGKDASPEQITEWTRQFFEHERLRNLLWTLAPQFSLAQMEKMFPIVGLEHLERAIAQKKGVILLGCHLNSICLFLALIMLRGRGFDVRVPFTEPGDPWAPSRLRRAFSRFGGDQRTVPERLGAFYCQFNIRPIIKALSANAIVTQTGDGWHSAAFVEVDFLGRRLPFTTGVLSVARTTGALVVPIFEVGAPPDKLTILIEEPFSVEKGGDPKKDIEVRLAPYVKRLEHHLLGNIPSWQHWLKENTLETMTAWTEKPLRERYHVQHDH